MQWYSVRRKIGVVVAVMLLVMSCVTMSSQPVCAARPLGMDITDGLIFQVLPQGPVTGSGPSRCTNGSAMKGGHCPKN